MLKGGVDWDDFISKHPSVVSVFNLPSITWDGKRFYSQTALGQWLAKSDIDYRAWARSHTEAAAVLAGKPGSGVKQRAQQPVKRLLSSSAVVTWDNVRFTRARALRLHLRAQAVDWQEFLIAHPSIATTFRLPSVQWDGTRFYTRAAIKAWMGRHGQDFGRWSEQHATALALLAD